MVRYDTYCDTGIMIRYVSRYIYYPLIYEMQNCVIEVPIKIYYNIWGNTYHNTIFSLAIRIVGAVYRYIVIHWWIVTSLEISYSYGVDLLDPSTWRIRICLACWVNIASDDDLATRGARSSLDMTLIWRLKKFQYSAWERINLMLYA